MLNDLCILLILENWNRNLIILEIQMLKNLNVLNGYKDMNPNQIVYIVNPN